MMKHLKHCVVVGLCALSLGGCVSREQADENLAKGCAAGVAALLPEGTTLGEIKEKTFSPSPEAPGARHVKLTAMKMDGYLEEEATYECVFEESMGFMNSAHTASIYQVRFEDQIIGKSGNEIKGDFEQFSKLTDAIRKAMYE